MTGSPSKDSVDVDTTAIAQQDQRLQHPENAPLAESSSQSSDDVVVPSQQDADKGNGIARGDPDPADTPGAKRSKTISTEDGDSDDDEDDGDDDDSGDEDESEEPRLKFAPLTTNLGPVYRNGDATSSFLLAGDKMIIGTHSGNIHVIQLPTFQSLRVYHAHSASVTSISISPYPPPLTSLSTSSSSTPPTTATATSSPRAVSIISESSHAAASRRPREPMLVPNTPSNHIYIATSSMDGNVCIQSLMDARDVQLRSFARPVQAVALSPDYKNDRTFLSGGLAGHLILTVGGERGRSTSTTVGTAAATASGWLGSMGLGSNTGKDTILHSSEGAVGAMKWSLSGRYVVWLNEHGIKIMRSKLHLDTGDAEVAWTRIGHIDRPQTDEWDTMAGVWKGRIEWIDEQAVETDDSEKGRQDVLPSSAATKLKMQADTAKVERLFVGWGGTLWIIHVHAGGIGTGKNAGEKFAARAEIIKILRMDCIISGISLYTQNLLLVLAYCLPEDYEESDTEPPTAPRGHVSRSSTGSQPSGGIKRRQNNQPPELRLIDLTSQAEVDRDGLSVSRYDRLSSVDYHLGLLPAQTASAVVAQRGALEALAGFGTDMWNVAINPRALFGSGASITSGRSGDDAASGSRVGGVSSGIKKGIPGVHPNLAQPGVKIFIHSPYDCIVATKRDLGDHLQWLLEREQFKTAWELLDSHPEIVTSPLEREPTTPTAPTPRTPTSKLAKAEGDNAMRTEDSSTVASFNRAQFSAAEKEKRRISDLWLKELVAAGSWAEAGRVCAKVLNTSPQWEKWAWTFVGAKRFDEIADNMPVEALSPPISTTLYELVLGHYIQVDKPRFQSLLEKWMFSTDLFDAGTIATRLENQLNYRDVREDSIEDGVKGRDWHVVMESLAKLYEARGRHREALRCFIRLHDADATFRLIRDNHLAEAVVEDIPAFMLLRVPPGHERSVTEQEVEAATAEAVTLLVDEAQHGLVRPSVVVSQLVDKGLTVYLFFYLRGLFRGEGIKEHGGENRDRLVLESKMLVDEFADLAVSLFAKYDRALLMAFLQSSTSYTFDKAVQECEQYKYDDELVHLYSKTGQTKRALYLIIERLHDVPKAIAFARAQDDPDLWADLLDYSMDKPRFIRALLEQVQAGSQALDPVSLVRRIPEGLEIEGLREGIRHIVKEHEIQWSISEGVARVLRSEVVGWQGKLRGGQRKGIKFEVRQGGDERDAETQSEKPGRRQQSGKCAECGVRFSEDEDIEDEKSLVGFACGHAFHLPHLVEAFSRVAPDTGRRPRTNDAEMAAFGVSERAAGGYRVGNKVTHARLLRDRMRGGCPVCSGKKLQV